MTKKILLKLSPDEFQRRYHGYETEDKEVAIRELRRLDVAGDTVVVFGPVLGRYSLMLKSAAEYIHGLNMGGDMIFTDGKGRNL